MHLHLLMRPLVDDSSQPREVTNSWITWLLSANYPTICNGQDVVILLYSLHVFATIPKAWNQVEFFTLHNIFRFQHICEPEFALYVFIFIFHLSRRVTRKPALSTRRSAHQHPASPIFVEIGGTDFFVVCFITSLHLHLRLSMSQRFNFLIFSTIRTHSLQILSIHWWKEVCCISHSIDFDI